MRGICVFVHVFPRLHDTVCIFPLFYGRSSPRLLFSFAFLSCLLLPWFVVQQKESRGRRLSDGWTGCVCACILNQYPLYIYIYMTKNKKKWRSRQFFCVHQISPNISRSWHLCLVTAVLLPFSALERSVTITEHRSQLSATFAHLKWVTELQNHIKGILFFYLFDWRSEESSLFLVSETIFVSISPKIFGLLAQ